MLWQCRMKIAFVLNEFPSFSETFVLNQLVGLLKRGHEVDIYADRLGALPAKCHADVGRYSLVARTRYQPLPRAWFARLRSAAGRTAHWGWRDPGVTLHSLNFLRYRRHALNLKLLHERLPAHAGLREYDVIHCHFGPNGERAVAWRKVGAIRGPVITSFHGYDVNRLPVTYGRNMYKTLFEHGDMFSVGTEFLKRRLILLGAADDRIVKLPMGVDLSRFHYAERRPTIDGEFRLLTVSRLVEVKGIEYALRAMAILKDKLPRLRYQIVGEGPLRTDLEALTARLDLAKSVTFMGALSQEEVIRLHEGAHVFVMPSVVARAGDEENQPVALAEAQASGLPVVASAIGGIPECMRDGESGLLVPPRDSEALASSILWLADHPEVLGSMGRAGRAQVEKYFNLEKLNDQLVDIYEMASLRARAKS